MRGNVYRLGRRRAGSIVLATGVALAFAVSGPPPAAAKAPIRATHSQSKLQARPSVIAHAAGHKIA